MQGSLCLSEIRKQNFLPQKFPFNNYNSNLTRNIYKIVKKTSFLSKHLRNFIQISFQNTPPHIFTVLSKLPDANKPPSGEKQTELTQSECPSSVASTCQVFAQNIFIF